MELTDGEKINEEEASWFIGFPYQVEIDSDLADQARDWLKKIFLTLVMLIKPVGSGHVVSNIMIFKNLDLFMNKMLHCLV